MVQEGCRATRLRASPQYVFIGVAAFVVNLAVFPTAIVPNFAAWPALGLLPGIFSLTYFTVLTLRERLVLTDTELGMKLSLGAPDMLPDVAIVDSTLTMGLPPRITADTGMDVLTHAIEAYSCTLRNDFTDGLALKATELVFKYLPTAYANGSDADARLRMHSAATIAGLAFGNAMLGVSHAMGHSMGAVLHVPHGRAVGLILPYAIEFTANGGGTRYGEIAHFVHLPAHDEEEGTAALVQAVRDISAQVSFATSIKALGIERAAFDQALPKLVSNAEADNQLFFNQRYADSGDLARLFEYAYEGRSIDF